MIEEIKQIIPAEDWLAVYKKDEKPGENIIRLPVVCFGIVRDENEDFDKIVGFDKTGPIPCEESGNFSEYIRMDV